MTTARDRKAIRHRDIERIKKNTINQVATASRLHVVSNTHWDREHRHGLQEMRIMLVEAVDQLIKIMQTDKGFKHFVFDGQSVVLEDYLEVKPGQEPALRELVQAGRLHIGPWYTLPDMQTVNPECLIRNLLIGDRVCQRFGPKMRFGYSIFSFGQIAQLPQLYGGFGIGDIITYKGYSPKVFKQSEFIWEAPDGTAALTSRLGTLSRMNFLFCFTIPVILGGDARKPGWEVGFTDGTRLAHLIDEHFRNHNATELEQDIHIRRDKVKQGIKETLATLSATTAKTTFLSFDGVDFSTPLREIPEALAEANRQTDEDLEVLHSTPQAYFKELRREIDIDSLLRYQGELRFGPIGKVHSECLSANVELKQKNAQVENTLLYYAEPFSVFRTLCGQQYPAELFMRTWKYLLKSHAHDSIHGIGVPKIKKDMFWRLEQAQELADGLARRAFEGIIADIDTRFCSEKDILVTVFNPTSYERSEVMPLQVDLPAREQIREYRLETIDGERVVCYEHGRKRKNIASVNGENRPKIVRCEQVMINALLPAIPPLGYKTFRLVRELDTEVKDKDSFPNPVFAYRPIGRTPNVLDNGLLRVEVASNSTVKVTDSETGMVAEGLNLFVDTACSGDMWIHREPAANRTITSYGAQAEISFLHNTGLSATLRTAITLNIPASLTQDRQARSEQVVPTQVITDIMLSHGSKRLDFQVHLHNSCMDHKFTAQFPTPIKTDHSNSEAAFEIRRRPIDETVDDHGKIGDVVLRHPMHGFVDLSDGKNGIALFGRGLKEFQTDYYSDGQSRLELTLLRAVTQTFPIHSGLFLDYDEEPSQCLGYHRFEYALYFHGGDYLAGNVIAASRCYALPLTAGQFGKGRSSFLPPEVSFVHATNRHLIINGLKRAEDDDRIILRLTNPTDQLQQGKLTFYHDLSSAALCDMNETALKPLTIQTGKRLSVRVPPFKILTLGLKFKGYSK